MARLLSIQVGRPQTFLDHDDSAKVWTSAIKKEPTSGTVKVSFHNIEGDEQSDLVHHGGKDKAILAYSSDHFNFWHSEFPTLQFKNGSFGENLTVVGMDEASCCVGDIIRIGDCRLQISQPRQPCWKLSRLWNLPKLAILVQQTLKTGWYYRVLEEGMIEAGIDIHLLDRPHPDLTIAWCSSVMYAKPRCNDDDLRLASCPSLSDSWRTTLQIRATKSMETNPSKRLFGDQAIKKTNGCTESVQVATPDMTSGLKCLYVEKGDQQ